MNTQRFVYGGQPVYNRHNLMAEIAKSFGPEYRDISFDIVLETVRTLEKVGIIETVEGVASTLFVVQDWEKML